MKDIMLLPHNEVGYNKLTTCLETNQVATINHATGTGKSFIILKYSYAHKDKRILYLAPTYPIIDQIKYEHTKELGIDINEFKQFDTMIYRSLLDLDMEELASKYDIIILDEYHRCGSLKWGSKVKKLKEIICNKYPDKKIIGTTATEIRYLDKERNMKDILFDGVEASRLTLADAILQGILPVPYYVNYDMEIFEEIASLRKKVNNFLSNKKNKEKILNELNYIEGVFRKNLFENVSIQQLIKDEGKYLVFSSDKERLKIDKQRIESIFDYKKYDEYVIHSDFKHEQNLQELSRFRNASTDKLSILYSIDILSEGVHVKDVYALFMCRKTTSPIKYFQQIGRLLSYSQRKEQVVVFDLVNNLKHHRIIYKLYEDVTSRAAELIESDPVNKQHYLDILNKFKIVDEASILYGRLDDLKKSLTKSNLIESILNEAANTLDNNTNLSVIELYNLKLDIKKYCEYITIDLFERFKKHNDILNIRFFELDSKVLEENFNGFRHLHDYKYKKYKVIVEQLKDFIYENDRFPSLFSTDEEELELAKNVALNYNKFRVGQKELVKKFLDNSTTFEKLYYGVSISFDSINFEELYEDIEYAISLRIPIKEFIVSELKVKSMYTNDKKIIKLIDRIKEYNSLVSIEIAKENTCKFDISSYFDSVSGEKTKEMYKAIEQLEELSKEESMDKIAEDIYNRTIDFIRINERMPKYINPYTHSVCDNEEENELYFSLIILNDMLEEKGYKKKIKFTLCECRNTNKLQVIQRVIEFMKLNNNELPYINSSDYVEKLLAQDFERIKNKLTRECNDIISPYLKLFMDNKKSFFDRIRRFDFSEYDEIVNSDSLKRFSSYLLPEESRLLMFYNNMYKIFNYMKSNNMELPKLDYSVNNEQVMMNFYNDLVKNNSEILNEVLGNFQDTKVYSEEKMEVIIEKEDKKTTNTEVMQKIITDSRVSEKIVKEKKKSDDIEKTIDKEYLDSLNDDDFIKYIINFKKEGIFNTKEKRKVNVNRFFNILSEYIKNNNYMMPTYNSKGVKGFFLAQIHSDLKELYSLEQKNILILYEEKFKINKAKAFNDYFEFVKNNHRLPSTEIEEEKVLVDSIESFYQTYTMSEKNTINILKSIEKVTSFIKSNNYELPYNNKQNGSEAEIFKMYNSLKKLFGSKEQMIFDEFKEQFEKSKIAFIDKYMQFITDNKRYPTLIQPEEHRLVDSYNRWLPYLNADEKKRLRSIKASQYKTMEKIYEMSIKK